MRATGTDGRFRARRLRRAPVALVAQASLPVCPWTEALLEGVEGGEDVLVPAHWPLEVANALLVARRRGRVTAEQVSEFIGDLAALPIRLEPPSGPAQWPAILALA